MKFKDYLDKIGEYGSVLEVRHPIVKVTGLPKAKAHEVVLFENGAKGQVFSLEQDGVDILVFSTIPITVGTRVIRTDEFIKVPVGEDMLGKIIDPLGTNYSNTSEEKEYKGELREIEIAPPDIHQRIKITRPLLTGTTLVDMMIPLGKGQKELIIGDRKTGKSAFLLGLLKQQIEQGSVVIYAGIARKQADIKRVSEFFNKNKLTNKTIIVATNSDDSPSLIYLTPYTAMTIAEYFAQKGKDVVIVFDDLSSHAKFYREISLLAKRFPGRDSYPGDIFYVHARLLERAGNFKLTDSRINELKDSTGKDPSINKQSINPLINNEVSISAFPVVETIEGDLTGYIQTNIMGMTDGHIFFDSNVYYNGRRPAINIELSVTRVGRQTQSPLLREISQTLASFLNEYDKMQTFSHFGAELSGKVKSVLSKGDQIYELFDQSYEENIPQVVQILLFALVWGEVITIDKLKETKTNLINEYSKNKNQYDEILLAKTIYELITKVKTLKI